MPRYDAEVDPRVCTGARLCTTIAPLAFTFDEAMFASVVRGGPFADDDAVVHAAQTCPVEAITVTDADTGEHVAP
jgi:ferredoxin